MAIFSCTEIWISYAILMGLLVGSFLNVVLYRLPIIFKQRAQGTPKQERMTLSRPCSSCPACGHKISPIENIPVISFLALRGKCRSCKTSISFRYPAIEILTGLISGLVAYLIPFGFIGALAILFSWFCIWIIIAAIDA